MAGVLEQSDSEAMVKYIGIFVSHLIRSFTADPCLCPRVGVRRWYVIPIGTAFIILTLIHQSVVTVHLCLSEPPTYPSQRCSWL